MAIESLSTFRNAPEGQNVQPVVVVTKDNNGNMVLAKTDPLTGALVVQASLDVSEIIPGDILAGFTYDAISQDRSAALVDVLRFYFGGLTGTLVATLTITYPTTDKEDFTSIVRS